MYKPIIFSFIFVTIFSTKLSPQCKLCHDVVSFIQHHTPPQPEVSILRKISIEYCVRKHMEVRHVCKGAIDAMTPFITNSVWRHYTDPHLICPLLKFCKKQYKKRNLTEEINTIIKDKPDKSWQAPTGRRNLKIMHMSDLHPDLFYTVGAPADCSEPVCCRANVTNHMNIWQQLKRIQNGQIRQVKPQPGTRPAGYWGSQAHCELPLQTFDLFLKDLEKMDLDLILWTGDNTPHDVWAQTQSYNLNYTMLLTEKLKKATNATIIPTIGNHESWPVNVYDFEGDRENVLNGGLAQAWRSWIGDEAFEMLRTKGYYKKIIPSLNNMKIISLNTQAGNDMNWFLLRDPTDPGKMLAWLEEQLRESEKINQYVWIIGHISPKSALNDWGMRYNALIDRYSYVVRGQFYGHSHVDHIAFCPTFKNREKLSGYYMISPSVTTASNKNPQYRIMDVDYDTLQVTQYYQYMLNLSTNPTKQSNPKFQLFYTFKDAYSLPDMRLEGGITELRNKLKNDPEYRIKYTYLMYGGLKKGESKPQAYCDTTTSRQFHMDCLGKQLKKTNFQKLAGVWKDLAEND